MNLLRMTVIIWLLSSVFSVQQSSSLTTSLEQPFPEQLLLHASVQAIIQDHQGFMWFATVDGLQRYDGYKIVPYVHNEKDTTTLSSNDVTCLCVDKEGVLWVGTNGGGLCRFNRENGTFTRYQHKSSDVHSIGDDAVRTIYEDKDGNLWIGTVNNGLDVFSREQQRFQHFKHDPTSSFSLSDNHIWSIAENDDGGLWVGTSKGLNKFDKREQHFVIHDIVSSLIRTIYVANDTAVWVGTDNGFGFYDERKAVFLEYPLSVKGKYSGEKVLALSILCDSSGMLWIGSNKGLLQLNTKVKQGSSLIVKESHVTIANDDIIAVAYRDRSGCIWCGTYAGAIKKFCIQQKRFHHYSYHQDPGTGLNDNNVFPIVDDSVGNIWVGTLRGGVNKVDRKRGVVKYFVHHQDNHNSLCSDLVSAIVRDRFGNLWFGTQEGLDKFDPVKKQFTHFKHISSDSQGLRSDNILSLFEDTSGLLWIGLGQDGINVYDRAPNTFILFNHDSTNIHSLSSNRVFCFYQDHGGVLWVGTDHGLNRYNSQSKTFDAYLHDPNDTTSLSNNGVMTLAEDSENNLWIGTYGGGIDKFDSQRKKFISYTTQHGLANDVVLGVIADSYGHLWVSTKNGLSKFDLKTKKFRNYYETDGLPGDDFHFNAYYQSSQGECFFGGSNGVVSFFPKDVRDNPAIPSIVITGFNVFDVPYSQPQSIIVTKNIQLSYKENHFSFEFAALEFTAPGKNRYQYQLEGYDKNWIFSGTRRYANYTNLDPDEYVFRVRGSNNDGVWNKDGTSMTIVITPPFWATWWFRPLVMVFIIAVLILLYNYRVNKIREVERLRLRIARDLHDDIGSNLGSIALVTDMVKEGYQSHDPEYKQLDQVSRTARQMMEAMKDIVWFINPDRETLQDIVYRMTDVAHSLLIGFEYTFDCPSDSLTTTRVPMDLKRNIFLIFKEALHNIVKHSHASKVDVNLQHHNGVLTMMIFDNGIGFDERAVRKGNGLQNLRARAKQIGGSLEIQSVIGKGTSIRVEVRIQ